MLKNFVYFVSDGEYVKIGITNNIGQRVYAMQTANARKLTVVHMIKLPDTSYAKYLEQRLHKHFSDKRAEGEWFKLNWSENKSEIDEIHNEIKEQIIHMNNVFLQARFDAYVCEDLEQNFPPLKRNSRFTFKIKTR